MDTPARERLEDEIGRIDDTRRELALIQSGLGDDEAHDVAKDRLDTAIHYLDMASRIVTNAIGHLPAAA